MKAPTGKLAFAYRTIANLEAERDALAQRCRELEEERNHFANQAQKFYNERDTLRADVEQARQTAEYWKAEHLAGNAAIEKLRQFVEFVRHAPVSSGVCCCGDNMASHPDPMCSGHTPVDEWDHALSGWLKELGVEP